MTTENNNTSDALALEPRTIRRDRTAGREANTVEREPEGRAKRVPLGIQQATLTASQREGYVRHWFNDNHNRIQAALAGGYQFVAQDGKASTDDAGSRVSKIVGTKEGGHPLVAFLMEIPEAWYKEDQQAKSQQVDDTEGLIRRGELTQKVGTDGSYVPSQGISIKRAR